MPCSTSAAKGTLSGVHGACPACSTLAASCHHHQGRQHPWGKCGESADCDFLVRVCLCVPPSPLIVCLSVCLSPHTTTHNTPHTTHHTPHTTQHTAEGALSGVLGACHAPPQQPRAFFRGCLEHALHVPPWRPLATTTGEATPLGQGRGVALCDFPRLWVPRRFYLGPKLAKKQSQGHSFGGAWSMPCMFHLGSRGHSFGDAWSVTFALHLGGSLPPPPGKATPLGQGRGVCILRLPEVMGAQTLLGPKPAKKRPTRSPLGAGRKGRGVSPRAAI